MSLAERMRAGETLITAWSGVPSVEAVELIVRSNFDAVTLDMQHGGHNEASVYEAIPRIAGVNKPIAVRVPVGRFDMASRALDFGAEMVIAPMINSVEDAAEFADAMKYLPMGSRSWGPTRAFQVHGGPIGNDYLASANQSTLAMAMIETVEAYEALDDILAVPGIDGVFIGPADYSISHFNGARVDPGCAEVTEVYMDIGQRVKAAGKLSAMFLPAANRAGEFQTYGFQFLSTGLDSVQMISGMNNAIEAARDTLG